MKPFYADDAVTLYLGDPAGTTGPAGPRPLRLGSLCTGYGGLDMAAAQVLDVELAWVADPDPGAAATLAHHHPNVPNLGDITAVDWTAVPPVDVLTAGYPCQPFSVAGKKQGTADERHLWPHIVRAIRVLRPQLVILENVANHLRLGFADVLADLAALGFDAEWCIAGASEVGAPHRRDRLFALAWPTAHPPSLRHQRLRDARGRRTGPADGRRAAADPARERRDEGWSEPARQLRGPHAPVGGDATHGAAVRRHATAGRATHDPLVQIDDLDAVDVGAVGDRVGVGRPPAGHQLDTEPCEGGAHLTFDALGRDSMRVHGGDERHHIDSGYLHGLDSLSRRPRTQQPAENPSTWGPYAAAIHRWEHVTGRPAPPPTEPGRNGKPRLSPAFVEWLMGLPAGWVTRVPGLSRNQQLRLLGNGVVPQQGAAAIALLLDRMEY